ncbi:hypothetical protein HS141_05270 [Cetobacterium somerae]|uniref:hypothetical protein n=1 Tax=Cetobacterium somerae TaxID=188913 RepID=UPI00211DCC42|nr:hypothetical protein [Cetobacterium somerae]MCQ9626380.1 hypothetical protein [Cetobacterium somerae]
MKKVLFGIMALSAVTFSNNNPGAPTGTGEQEGASVPVLVKAEIIAPSDSIQITDLAGQLLPKIELDHGRIIKGAATASSVVYQDFKVIKGPAAGGTGVEIGGTGAKMAVAIDGTDTELKNSTTGISTDTLTSNLSLLGGKDAEPVAISGAAHGYEVNLAEGVTEHRGRIYSELTAADLNDGELGYYDNGSERTLTVLYTPAP